MGSTPPEYTCSHLKPTRLEPRPDFLEDTKSLLGDMLSSREKLNEHAMELKLDHKEGKVKSAELDKLLCGIFPNILSLYIHASEDLV